MKTVVIRCDRCGSDMDAADTAPINTTIGDGLMQLALAPAKDKDVCPSCRKTVLGEALAKIGSQHGLRLKRMDGPRFWPSGGFFSRGA